MSLAGALAALRVELSASGARFALVGGVAVSVRAEPRFTRDIDVAVAVATDGEAEVLTWQLAQAGWLRFAIVEQEHTGRLAQVRLRPPVTDPVVCDLLFASSGIELEVAAAADEVEALPGVMFPVATVGHLIALKLLSVDESRLQDRLDISALLEVATDPDLQAATDAVALITARGANRGRDLLGAMSTLRQNRERPTR